MAIQNRMVGTQKLPMFLSISGTALVFKWQYWADVVGSHMLAHSFQNSKTQELSAVEHGGAEEETKPSSSCRQEQGDRRGDKGRVRETEGRQRDASLANKAAVTNLSGHRLFETYCRNRDSQVKHRVPMQSAKRYISKLKS